MLIRLAAFATLGYVAYKYLQTADRSVPQAAPSPGDIRLAGGQLSSEAQLQENPNEPPSELDPQEAANPT